MNFLAAVSTTPIWVVIGYLVLLLGLGIYSSTLFKGTSRDYFVASRSIGSFMLLMSVFGTTMTGFALVGSTGQSFLKGIGVYGAMASWSGLVHSAIFFLVGIRLWAIGKRNGYVTQVQFFRDRFQSQTFGYVLFVLLILLIIPYLLIGILSAGSFVAASTKGMYGWGDGIPPWLTGLVICSVVLTYVFLGGIRSAAWANTFQTLVFMVTGVVAFFMISQKISHDIANHKDAGMIENIRYATEFTDDQPEARRLLVRGVHAEDHKQFQEDNVEYRIKFIQEGEKDPEAEWEEQKATWAEGISTELEKLQEHDKDGDFTVSPDEFKSIPKGDRKVFAVVITEALKAGGETAEQVTTYLPDHEGLKDTLATLRSTGLEEAKATPDDFNSLAIRLLILPTKPEAGTEPKTAAAPVEPTPTFSDLLFISYLFIPISVGMFPHVFQHWLTAKSAKSFRLPIIAHPICIAIVWLPCILIGVWAAGLHAAAESGSLPTEELNSAFAGLSNPNHVLGTMVQVLVDNPLLTGLLMAGVLAAIMSSLDSQFVCLGTMFTNDIFMPLVDEHDYTDRQKVWVARFFTLGVVVVAYLLSLLWHSKSVFDLAIWCFTGFTALTPLVIAAIYWKRVTLPGAYACVGVTVILGIYLFSQPEWGDKRGYLVAGLKPVAPLTLASVAALIFVSLLTNPPAKETLRKFFPSDNQHSNNKQQKSSTPREQKRGTDRRQNHGNRNRRGRRPRNQD